MKTIVAAISSGAETRCIRLILASSWISAGVRFCCMRGVSVVPGTMQLTRMPAETWSIAKARVSAITPPFAAE